MKDRFFHHAGLGSLWGEYGTFMGLFSLSFSPWKTRQTAPRQVVMKFKRVVSLKIEEITDK